MQKQHAGKRHTVNVFGFSVSMSNSEHLGSQSQKEDGDKKQYPTTLTKSYFQIKILCFSDKTVYKLCQVFKAYTFFKISFKLI